MEDIIQRSCRTGNENVLLPENTNILCPRCREAGMGVTNVTVRHIVKKEFIEKAGAHDYYLCMSERCDVAYYTENGSALFEKDELKVPLWYKDGADPKYICYCGRITEEDVEKAVKEKHLTDISGIRSLYDPDGKCQCKIKNPTGKCCHEGFRNAINRAKRL